MSIAALILMNAYFVASEFALVAVRRSQVKLWEAEGRAGAAAVARAIEKLDDSIAATQLGITVASVGLGFLGEPALARLIDPVLRTIGIDSFVAVHAVALTLAFSIVTFLHVVVGELAPKALALDRPGEIALACARPLLLFGRCFRPILWVMNGAGNLLVRRLGVAAAGHSANIHSAKELQFLVREAYEAGEIPPYAARMLGNVLRISRKHVRDVMVPRESVCALPWEATTGEILETITSKGYTRIPIYRVNPDQIVGLLHSKDLLRPGFRLESLDFEKILRPVIEMSPRVTVFAALSRFRKANQQLAIVREPRGPVQGIVTLEDLVEEIVGEIEDEHDVPHVHEPIDGGRRRI